MAVSAEDLDLDPGALARSDEEAAARYKQWKEQDPFPEIEPALLNSADLFDYIATTGMIFPFELDPRSVERSLKPASCGLRLGGEYSYWSFEDGMASGAAPKKIDAELAPDGILRLPRNSIVYATLASKVQLPDYIAARFNLTIKYVYRGLLVGTGPLVDPGFSGRLHVPIHNLTSSECQISAHEVVVWMEFTKISRNQRWQRSDNEKRQGSYVPFPERKRHRSFADLLDLASDGKPIISSIPELVERATDAAEESAEAAMEVAESAESVRRRAYFIQLGAGLAVIGILLGCFYYLNGRQDSMSNDVNDAIQRVNQLEAKLDHAEVTPKIRRSK
jgi:deoxycytidine triphosphate deaminase